MNDSAGPALGPDQRTEEGFELGATATAGDRSVLRRRPTETVAGVALFGTIYGLLTQSGVDQPLAAIAGVVIAFVPGAISFVVDAVRGA